MNWDGNFDGSEEIRDKKYWPPLVFSQVLFSRTVRDRCLLRDTSSYRIVSSFFGSFSRISAREELLDLERNGGHTFCKEPERHCNIFRKEFDEIWKKKTLISSSVKKIDRKVPSIPKIMFDTSDSKQNNEIFPFSLMPVHISLVYLEIISNLFIVKMLLFSQLFSSLQTSHFNNFF